MVKRILDWLSKIFKTDFHYIAKGGSTLSVMHVVSALVSFGLTIAFANLLPPETYGTYRYILSVYAFLGVLVLPGIDTAVIQAVSRGFDGSLKEAFARKLRWGILGSAASALFAIFNLVRGDVTLAIIFFFIALIIPFMEAASVYTAFMNGKKLYRPWVVMDITTLIVSGAIIASTLLLTKNIFIIILAYFIPLVIMRLIFFYRTRRFAKNQNTDPGLTAYGKQVTLFQIISRAIASIDQIVLFNLLGPAQVAVFSLAMAIPNRARGLLRISGTLAIPKFSVRESGEVARSLWKKIKFFIIFIIFWSLVYVLIAPWIFKFLFPQYIESINFSRVLIFFTLSSITYPISSLFFAHKKMKENYIISIGSISAKIIALAIFVPLYGIWGGVISVLAASLSTITISLILLRRIARTPQKTAT